MRENLESILREAGEIMLAAQGIERSVREKEGSANFVTAYDVKVQELLKERLLALCPRAHFMGEEGDLRADVLHGEAFIVDPIDGTTNFIRGLNASAVSVAYLSQGEVVEAATFDPYRNEFYYAQRGKGATCNGVPIHVSELPLSESLVCFGTSPYYEELVPRTFELARRLMGTAADLRRSGSAVIDLTWVARGSAGLMFELKLSPWDYAAASLLVTEAGGVISQLDGSPLTFDRGCGVVAGSPKAWAEFFELGLNVV